MSENKLADIEAFLVGSSLPMVALRGEVVRIAKTNLPVLVEGPTGVGKELVARALHLASGRDGAFVAFNICAVSETMFEDALFGHVKGAFTGAIGEVQGYLAEANGGSILLDEINGSSLNAQAKLLRAVETGVYRPVGAARDRQTDTRVIAASNADLDAAVRTGSFRRDLLYRLSAIRIRVPALALRRSDIAELARHLLTRNLAAADYAIDQDAMALLERHDWPGNVRELRNALARALTLADDSRIRRADIAEVLGSRTPDGVATVFDLNQREHFRSLLEAHQWDTARVANSLGIHRATVYRRMQRYRLAAPEVDAYPGMGRGPSVNSQRATPA